MYICIYIHMGVCMYVCMYGSIYTHTCISLCSCELSRVSVEAFQQGGIKRRGEATDGQNPTLLSHMFCGNGKSLDVGCGNGIRIVE